MSDRLQTARGVEARSELVRERLVLDETVLPRQPDGVFIEALRVRCRSSIRASSARTSARRLP